MKHASWWKSAVFYELYVDKFAGNFKGLTENLDYFSALGIDCLHILPHYPSPMVDDGYDISDYRAVRAELGTLDDFTAFTAAAHDRKIRILIDLVLNHVSDRHPWFVEARSSKDNLKHGYFLWSETGSEFKDARNVFAHLKPKNWIYNVPTGDYFFTTFYAEQPDLNWNNPAVFDEMTGIMDFWIERGVDGFRLDAAPYLIKKEGTNSRNIPETHAVLKRIRAHLEARAPGVVLLSEVNDTLNETKKYFGADPGDECHLNYHFPLAEKIIMAAFKNDPAPVAALLGETGSIPSDCEWAVFTRNHDQLSLITLSPEEHTAFTDYCDLRGVNRFATENGIAMRLASIFKKDPEKIRLTFDLLLSLPAASVVYYGEEIGMENDYSQGIQKDTRRYVRGLFDWEKARTQMNDPDSLFSFVAERIRARKIPVAVPAKTLAAAAG